MLQTFSAKTTSASSMAQSKSRLPRHLQKYVVEQNYDRYTPEDQAVWRYIMRQLNAFLSKHAHPCYVEGLRKTGISLERIPRIEEMDRKLQDFGWGAVPVAVDTVEDAVPLARDLVREEVMSARKLPERVETVVPIQLSLVPKATRRV